MHARRGFIGIVCVVVTAVVLLITNSVYGMIAADYKYAKTSLRQQQCVQAAVSSLESLERRGLFEGDFHVVQSESLPPDDNLQVVLQSVRDDNVVWLSSQARIADVEVRLLKTWADVPQVEHDFYNYDLVSKQFNIAVGANVENAQRLNYASTGGEFLRVNTANYARHAFVMPTGELWSSGVGRNIYYDNQNSNVHLVNTIEVKGSSAFVSEGSIYVGAGSKYRELTHFIANGNVVVEPNVQLDRVVIVAGAAVKLSRGSRVQGKIIARNGIIIESGAKFSGMPNENLQIVTDKYIR